MNSMKISLDLSLQYVREKDLDAVRLFGLLGLLPGGIEQIDLDQIWGSTWIHHASILFRFSLIIKREKGVGLGPPRYTMYPFMTSYAVDSVALTELLRFKKKVKKHLRNKVMEIFEQVSDSVVNSAENFDKFRHEEINIKACLKREMEDLKKAGALSEVRDSSNRLNLSLDHIKNISLSKHNSFESPHTSMSKKTNSNNNTKNSGNTTKNPLQHAKTAFPTEKSSHRESILGTEAIAKELASLRNSVISQPNVDSESYYTANGSDRMSRKTDDHKISIYSTDSILKQAEENKESSNPFQQFAPQVHGRPAIWKQSLSNDTIHFDELPSETVSRQTTNISLYDNTRKRLDSGYSAAMSENNMKESINSQSVVDYQWGNDN